MPSLINSSLVTLGCSLNALSSASALQLQASRTVRWNPIAPAVAPHRCTTRCHDGIARRRRTSLGLSSHRRGTEEDEGPSKSKREESKTPDDDDDDDDDGDDDAENEGFIKASDFVDFESMDKLFNDLPEYGVIRSLESPNSNPIEPVSAEEIEMWTRKNDLRTRKEERGRLWRRVFPWVSPFAALLFPRRYTPSIDYRSDSERRLGNIAKRRHSNFNDGAATPKSLRGFVSTPNSARNLLVALNAVAFIYQIVTAVQYLPGFNRVLAASVAGDAYSAAAVGSNIPQWTPKETVLRALGLVGGGAGVVIASGSTMRGQMGRIMGRGPIAAHSMGPFFLDYAHQPYPLSHFQKHRYLSSGFLHGSLLHLGMNLRAMLSMPSWLENGIGKGVYLSAYLGAIVTGNVAHSLTNLSGRAASSLCIGASGGVCGLYGLMLSGLMRMGNSSAAYYVLKQMVWLVAFGFLVPNVSNAGHVGGFVGGWLVGYLFGPGYERSYALNRADGASRDSADVEFRRMMGPGIYPSSDKAILPLKYLWMGIGAAMLARPDLRLVPLSLLRGILAPGAMSGVRSLLRS